MKIYLLALRRSTELERWPTTGGGRLEGELEKDSGKCQLSPCVCAQNAAATTTYLPLIPPSLFKFEGDFALEGSKRNWPDFPRRQPSLSPRIFD